MAKKKTARHAKRKTAHRTKRAARRKAKLPQLRVEQETPYPVRNFNGDVLTGVLHEPLQESKTLVIAVHGFLGSKNQGILRQACIELARAGYSAYRFDLSGNGDSEGRFEDATPSKMLRDISAVIEHFRSRYAKLILLGHSLGGALTIVAASRAKVDGVIALAAPMHHEHFNALLSPAQREQLVSVGFTIIMAKRSVGDVPYTITERFFSELRELQPLAAAKEVHCHVLVAYGTADTRVPPSDSQELIAALFSKDLFLIGGADHNITNPIHADAFIAAVVAWLGKHDGRKPARKKSIR